MARARFHSDDANAQLDLGKFLLLDRRFEDAAEALEQCHRLDPGRSIDYFLALSDVGLGRLAEARARLSRIPAQDAFSEQAQKLLRKLTAASGAGPSPR